MIQKGLFSEGKGSVKIVNMSETTFQINLSLAFALFSLCTCWSEIKELMNLYQLAKKKLSKQDFNRYQGMFQSLKSQIDSTMKFKYRQRTSLGLER